MLKENALNCFFKKEPIFLFLTLIVPLCIPINFWLLISSIGEPEEPFSVEHVWKNICSSIASMRPKETRASLPFGYWGIYILLLL